MEDLEGEEIDSTSKIGTIQVEREPQRKEEGKPLLSKRKKVKEVQREFYVSMPVGHKKVSEEDFKSKMGKGSASDFTASNHRAFSGFGLSGHRPFFDPTDVEEDTRTTKPSAIFGKSNEDIGRECDGVEKLQFIAQKLRQSIVVYNDLTSVLDTSEYRLHGTMAAVGKDLSVTDQHLNVLAWRSDRGEAINKLLTSSTSSREDQRLSDLNCGEGIVEERSHIPAGYIVGSEDHVRGIYEVTDGAKAPAEVMRKGAAEATNVAIMQLKLGVNVTDIVVPVVASNGYLMQFGAVIMLQPSFPTFIMLTHVLDLTDKASLAEAARMLYCIQSWTATVLTFPNAEIYGDLGEMSLSRDAYHLKPLIDFYTSTGSMQSSLYHFFDVMAHLHKNEVCRKHIVFPICVREYDNNREHSSIVFPKLDSSYKVGLPDMPELRTAFMSELRRIIAAFHEAGVVHLDLFLSNIMWRQVGPNEVQLKIIDWDSALFADRPLPYEVRQTLSISTRHDLCWKLAREEPAEKDGKYLTTAEREQREMKMYDTCLLRMLEKYIDEPSLRVGVERGMLDKGFRTLLWRYIQGE